LSELEKLLIELSNAFGPSGFEKEARAIFGRQVAEHTEISYDNLGSILAVHYGSFERPKILLASHLDEVGLIVRGILPTGYLKVVALGSWWTPVLLGQRMVIRSRNGDHYGIIGAKPPHLLDEEDKSRPLKMADLYIDVGARNGEEVAALGIETGDPVIPAVRAELLSPQSRLTGKALDDRAGCAVVIQVLRELSETHPNTVIGAGTVQEENGLKGARTVASLVQPDLCLVLEGPPADDLPDAGSIVQGRLGGGPQIRRYDPSMIANQALADLAISEAKKLGIPYQVAIRESGGTDGREIQIQAPGGTPTLVIGVPVRYAHSPHGIVCVKDLEHTVQLVKAMLQMLDEAKAGQLKKNPW
jgi:putative aminopeptidase FrvX